MVGSEGPKIAHDAKRNRESSFYTAYFDAINKWMLYFYSRMTIIGVRQHKSIGIRTSDEIGPIPGGCLGHVILRCGGNSNELACDPERNL